MQEVASFKKQRLSFNSGECVSKAIAEIQTGAMLSLTEIAIRIPRDSSLLFRDRLNHESAFTKKIVKPPAGDGVAASIDYRRRFYVAGRRNTATSGLCDCFGKAFRLRLVAQNRDDC